MKIPLSLYIHLPWCVKKCPYCDFNSYAIKQEIPAADYIQQLIKDLGQDCQRFDLQDRVIESIFIGGGTPSLFKAKQLDRLFNGLRQQLKFSPEIEITLEANPGTIEHDDFEKYRAIGINRISLGVQSFCDQHLKKLGRIHSAANAIAAIKKLGQANFTNFNIDLMHGLPNQSTADALSDLEQAIELQPSHISWYQLTIEPNTAFAVKPPQLPHEDALASIEEQGKQLLAKYGFEQYEVSAFSRINKQCQHNLNYWQFGDYIGIGAGAHGKITNLKTGAITRTAKLKYPKSYLDATQLLAHQRQLTTQELPLEFMLNALRLSAGFAPNLFEHHTMLSLSQIEPTLERLKQKKLLSISQQQIKPTNLGRRFLNDCLLEFQTC